MGLMDSVRSMMGTNNQSQPASGNLPANPNQPGPVNPPGANSGTPGNDPNQQKSPLDAYAELFKPADPTKAKSAEPPKFALDPTVIDNAANSMDFLSKLPQDLKDRIESGDRNAMLEAMNFSNREAYKAAISHMSNLTDRFVGLRSNFDQQSLGTHVKNHLVRNTIDSSFANANPVARESLNWVSEKMRVAFPDASPDWIAKQAPQFFVEMAKALAPDQFKQADGANSADPNLTGEVDWASWLASEAKN